jgi:hypothetical protein
LASTYPEIASVFMGDVLLIKVNPDEEIAAPD